MQGEMWRKARGHGIGEPGFVQPDRPMSAIGGSTRATRAT